MNKLFIDSSDSKEIVVGLKKGRERHVLRSKTDLRKAQVILILVEKILKKYSIRTLDLSSVEVSTGPGSYTGIRVGVSVANTFGFILGISVNGGSPGTLVGPIYK